MIQKLQSKDAIYQIFFKLWSSKNNFVVSEKVYWSFDLIVVKELLIFNYVC